MSECTNWTNWTICGHCTLCVPCDERGINTKPHNCEVIYALKEQVNAALSDIQKIFEYKFAELNKQLSSCIDVGLMYSERQSRETWQGGAQVSINDLYGRVTDLEIMVKEHLLCVDNSQADENAKRFRLAPITNLNECLHAAMKGVDKTVFVARDKDKSLIRFDEYPAIEQAARIIELERQLELREIEKIAAINEGNFLRERVYELSKENEILREGLDAMQKLNPLFKKNESEVFNGGCKL